MQDHASSPLTWFQQTIAALQWPVVAGVAFALGRYVQRLETRVQTAEGHVKSLIERHLPQVHRALAMVNAKLDTLQALFIKGKSQ